VEGESGHHAPVARVRARGGVLARGAWAAARALAHVRALDRRRVERRRVLGRRHRASRRLCHPAILDARPRTYARAAGGSGTAHRVTLALARTTRTRCTRSCPAAWPEPSPRPRTPTAERPRY